MIVPIYPASTTEGAAYVASHSDAKVIFVDTPALLGRLLEAWSSLSNVSKIVTLDDSLDAERVRESAVAKGIAVPSKEDVAKRVITWGKAREIGARKHAEDPSGFEKMMHGVSIEQLGMMLYTSGTSGNPKGVPLSTRTWR